MAWAGSVSHRPIARRLKKAMETYKRAAFDDQVEIWQAGKGVDRIESIESCEDVVEGFRKGLM